MSGEYATPSRPLVLRATVPSPVLGPQPFLIVAPHTGQRSALRPTLTANEPQPLPPQPPPPMKSPTPRKDVTLSALGSALESRRHRSVLARLALTQRLDAAYARDRKLAESHKRDFTLHAARESALEKEQREALLRASTRGRPLSATPRARHGTRNVTMTTPASTSASRPLSARRAAEKAVAVLIAAERASLHQHAGVRLQLEKDKAAQAMERASQEAQAHRQAQISLGWIELLETRGRDALALADKRRLSQRQQGDRERARAATLQRQMHAQRESAQEARRQAWLVQMHWSSNPGRDAASRRSCPARTSASCAAPPSAQRTPEPERAMLQGRQARLRLPTGVHPERRPR
jgi:hypothetical protein